MRTTKIDGEFEGTTEDDASSDAADNFAAAIVETNKVPGQTDGVDYIPYIIDGIDIAAKVLEQKDVNNHELQRRETK